MTISKTKLLLASILFTTFIGCTKDEPVPVDPVTPPPPTVQIVELSGNLTTQTLTADKKYIIRGQVFVKTGVVLTIQPGTVIFGEKRTKGTLVIDRGGRIEAKGTASQPIVFTSNQLEGDRDRGDWGGLVILGNASCNQVDPAIEGIDPAVFYGGNAANTKSTATANDADNSGTLEYVRVEFAGIELTPNNETNSITMGGVGNGTKMEYVMVSYGGDDGFEWFGGTVNGRYLISHNSWDDDFDVDFGYSGNNQFGVALRYPSYADQSGSNIFECDNGPNDNDVKPYTTGTFSNFTGIGPIKAGATTSNLSFQHAVDLRRRTAVSILNSAFSGMPLGVRMNQPSVVSQYSTGVGILSNNIILTNGTTANQFLVATGSTTMFADSVRNIWTRTNQVVAGPSTDALNTTLGISPDLFYGTRTDEQLGSNPNFAVATAATISTGASFTLPKFSESNRTGKFTTVTYRGAFGATDWTDGWAEFNPVVKKY